MTAEVAQGERRTRVGRAHNTIPLTTTAIAVVFNKTSSVIITTIQNTHIPWPYGSFTSSFRLGSGSAQFPFPTNGSQDLSC